MNTVNSVNSYCRYTTYSRNVEHHPQDNLCSWHSNMHTTGIFWPVIPTFDILDSKSYPHWGALRSSRLPNLATTHLSSFGISCEKTVYTHTLSTLSARTMLHSVQAWAKTCNHNALLFELKSHMRFTATLIV